MKRNTSVCIVVVIGVIALSALYGCPKKAEVTSEAEQQPQRVEPAPVAAADDSLKAEEARKAAEEKATMEAAASLASGLQPVYFDYDRSTIRDDSKSVMQTKAAWLIAHPTTKIRIEGHCDERGTTEYNQALGQRRAQSAKKYLNDLGISAERMVLLTYGKEKPACTESTEECWQKNRRDDFIIVE